MGSYGCLEVYLKSLMVVCGNTLRCDISTVSLKDLIHAIATAVIEATRNRPCYLLTRSLLHFESCWLYSVVFWAMSSLDDAETGLVVRERFSVSIHLPTSYTTPSMRATDFGSSMLILNARQIPRLQKPLPPIPPRPVSKRLVSAQLQPRKSLRQRPSRWIRFGLWFNTYR